MNILTQKYLRECYNYNYQTGDLVWKERPVHHFSTASYCKKFNARFAGKISGCVSTLGYVVIKLSGKTRRAHRLIWLMEYGYMPDIDLDHINHIKTDNRLINLRLATAKDNARNQPLSSTNTSGYNGVGYRPNRSPNKPWYAAIQINGKYIYLGGFKDKADAVEARKKADIEYNFHKHHGLNIKQ